MKRLVIGNALAPSQFVENVAFSDSMPYYLCRKQFLNDDVVIPHYASSVEILICENVSGCLIIDKNQYVLEGNYVFYIPPNTVHSHHLNAGEGEAYVLKLSPEALRKTVDVERLLNGTGDCTLYCEPFLSDAFEALRQEIDVLERYDGQDLYCIQSILRILCLLSPHMKRTAQRQEPISDVNKNKLLKTLIDYSEAHFLEGLSNRTAAKFIGYNESYFCRWFLRMTGMTYNDYLMHLKINYACKMLELGIPVKEIVERLGYTNTSFFIQKFREYVGCTPGAYARSRGMTDMEEEKKK